VPIVRTSFAFSREGVRREGNIFHLSLSTNGRWPRRLRDVDYDYDEDGRIGIIRFAYNETTT
jgi:hypothetical protein